MLHIPSDNHIRRQFDGVGFRSLYSVFDVTLQQLDDNQGLKPCRQTVDRLPTALDGCDFIFTAMPSSHPILHEYLYGLRANQHGLSSVLLALNLIALAFHTTCDQLCETWHKACEVSSRHHRLFVTMDILNNYALFDSCHHRPFEVLSVQERFRPTAFPMQITRR